MRRELHVRFREGGGVRFPSATRHVMGFQNKGDAQRALKAITERLAGFNLKLHPEKTRIIRFGRFANRDCALDGQRRPATFEFLGFRHICVQRPDGRFKLVRRTSSQKRKLKLAEIYKEIRRRRHDPVIDQYKWLNSVMRGHFNYYGVPGNFQALESYRFHIRRSWHASLQRRSQRAKWNRERLEGFDKKFPLLRPEIVHPWPHQRFPS